MGKLLDLIPGLAQIKLSATTVIWILVGLSIVGLAGGAAWEFHEIKGLEQASGADKIQISDLQAANTKLSWQLQLQQNSGAITNTVTNADVTQKQAATTSTSTITTNANNAVAAIVQKYQPQGPAQVLPASAATAEQKEIDNVDINSMWQTYCMAVPTNQQCAQVLPKTTAAPAAPASSTPAAQVGPIAMN
jgi:hypothetical protein